MSTAFFPHTLTVALLTVNKNNGSTPYETQHYGISASSECSVAYIDHFIAFHYFLRCTEDNLANLSSHSDSITKWRDNIVHYTGESVDMWTQPLCFFLTNTLCTKHYFILIPPDALRFLRHSRIGAGPHSGRLH